MTIPSALEAVHHPLQHRVHVVLGPDPELTTAADIRPLIEMELSKDL